MLKLGIISDTGSFDWYISNFSEVLKCLPIKRKHLKIAKMDLDLIMK